MPALTALVYPISYGNEATASASAQTVIITDPLNTTTDDLSTFTFGPISVAGQTLFPPQGTAYATTVDMRPGTNLLVGVDAHVDTATGIATWKFTSIDPSTGLPTTNPAAGFLPPGANGTVFFTVMPKQNVTSGTKVQNQATIVFDANPPMSTPIWLNTFDVTAPTSNVKALPAAETVSSFIVNWAGTDADSGLQDYTIFDSVDGGAYAPWLTNATATSATFNGQTGHTYAFYSIARDDVGNVEAAKSSPDTTTTVVTPVLTVTAASLSRAYGKANPALTYAVTGFVNGDTSSVVTGSATLTTTATSASSAGPYPISFVTEGLTAANYTFVYVPGTLTVTPATVATPAFSPGGGTFTSAQMVKISDASSGAVIHYTVDGSTPTVNSAAYTSAVQINTTSTLRAVAVLNGVLSAVAGATYTINAGSCQTIDFSTGFTTAGLSLNGGATVTNHLLQLTDGNPFEARSAFYSTMVPVDRFSVDMTLQLVDPMADGITFVIQSNSPHVVGQPGGGLGYAGIPKSVAMKLDLHNNGGEGVNSTGTYINGAFPSTPSIDLTPAGIDLHSGHIFAVHLVYANGVTTGTIRDTVSGKFASMAFPGNIPAVVGKSAYVGFTGGTGRLSATQNILSWTFSGGIGCSTQ